MLFSEHGLEWVLDPHHCKICLTILMFFGLFVNCLGAGHYPVCFQHCWWILIFLIWDVLRGCGCYCFRLASCLGCRGCWYGHCLKIHPWRWMGPIFILFNYFSLCFSCIKCLGFPVIFPSNMSTSFISASSFSVPQGANRLAGAGYFSVMINYVAAWLDALA